MDEQRLSGTDRRPAYDASPQSPGARPLPSRYGRWLLLLVLTCGLAWHAAYYYPFFSDDALITLRYTQRLCAGRGLTWTDGERVEGYSDLLWVLLNAPAACLGLDPMVSARVLDFCGALLALWVIGWAVPWRAAAALIRLGSAGALWVLTGAVAAWAVGGLEHGFMLGVLALGVHLGRHLEIPAPPRRLLAAGVCFGALVLLRADGVVLLVAATAGRYLPGLARRGGSARTHPRAVLLDLSRWLACPLSLLLAQVLFRRAYYGTWLPNTAVAKVSFSWFRLVQGLTHVGQGYLPLLLLLLLALAGAALSFDRRTPARTTVPVVVAAGWSAYLALIGGDIFPGWRQLSLAVPPLALLVADGAEALAAGALLRAPHGRALAAAGFSAILITHGALQFADEENIRAKQELWEWAGRPMGKALKRTFSPQAPLLAVDAAGALPYWSELPALDMLGLNDAYIAHHPPPGFGRGAIGHELGDPDYVWQRAPDLIAFCGAVGHRAPCFTSGRGIFSRAEFAERYQVMRAKAEPKGPLGHIYVKRDSHIGLDRGPRGVVVPSYLLTDGAAIAQPGRTGRLAVLVRPSEPAQIERLRMPAGTYRVQTTPPLPRIAVACDGVSPAIRDGDPQVVRLSADTRVAVAVGTEAGADPVWLKRLSLQSTTAPAGLFCGPRTADGPVRRSAQSLATDPPPGPHWWQPGAVRFGKPGLRLTLPTSAPASPWTHLVLVSDGNDRYALTFLREGKVLARIVARAVGTGLRERRLRLPPGLSAHVPDALQITPLSGDGFYSVAHLSLES